MKNKSNGLVLKINNDIEIRADLHQYILIYNSSKSYYDSLESVFSDLFEMKVKENLVDSKKKTIEDILKIHKEIVKWLRKIFKTIERPKFDK